MKPSPLTWLFSRFPRIAEIWAKSYRGIRSGDIPWSPLRKPLSRARVALVTTGGVHLREQPRFDMEDKLGDPSYRELPSALPDGGWTITHEYYDHRDADRDINLVLPLERLAELVRLGEVGETAPRHFSFMGHIDGPHIATLVDRTAPEAASKLVDDGVDAVLLAPA